MGRQTWPSRARRATAGRSALPRTDGRPDFGRHRCRRNSARAPVPRACLPPTHACTVCRARTLPAGKCTCVFPRSARSAGNCTCRSLARAVPAGDCTCMFLAAATSGPRMHVHESDGLPPAGECTCIFLAAASSAASLPMHVAGGRQFAREMHELARGGSVSGRNLHGTSRFCRVCAGHPASHGAAARTTTASR
jgi:hypothetical protein